jgi:hypothetical protein
MIERVFRAVQALTSEPTTGNDNDVEIEQLQAEVRVLRQERDDERRQKEDLFDLVVRMEKQRDEWRARFMEQWHQHQNAQSLLEQHIQTVGTTLVRAVDIANEVRKAAGLEPLTLLGMKRIADEGERVLRSSAEYGAAMRSLEGAAAKRDRAGNMVGWEEGKREPDIDGDAARKSVVGGG